MCTARWLEIKNILDKVVDMPAAQRRLALTELCEGDAGLRAEVESFLELEGEPGECRTLATLDTSTVGQTLGHYRVVRELGRGGMGVVYLGERSDELYEKRVAIKVLDTVFLPVELLERFDAERRILARLNHPAIAGLIDAGLTAEQKPYYVMELVDGQDLTSYLASGRAALGELLDLFVQVCDAVSHAHRQLIIHLDLKPGNIMVAKDGSPKLLDFGVAHLLEPAAGKTGHSGEGLSRILTPSYASPEQIKGGPVTIASDIFSLGMILSEIATQPGDLDFVVAKATAEEPAARYRSVDELADDVRNCAAKKPVMARESTFLYRASRLVARHRMGTLAAGAAILGLLLALGMALYEARLAERRLNEVHQAANSLLFELHDAIQTLPGATGARELVLKRAMQYLDTLSKEAGGNTALKRDLAQSYLRLGDVQGLYFEANLGRQPEAKESYGRALALYRQIAEARPFSPGAKVDLAEAHIRVASAFSGQKKSAEALEQLGRAEEIARSVLIRIPPVDIALAKVNFGRAENYARLGRMPEALAARRECLTILERLAVKRPENAQLRRFVGLAHKRYGASLLEAKGSVEEATAEIQKAMVIDSAAVARDGNNAVAKADLALDETYLSAALQRGGDLAGAVEQSEKATAAYAALVEADGKDVRSRALLATSQKRLANLRKELSKINARNHETE